MRTRHQQSGRLGGTQWRRGAALIGVVALAFGAFGGGPGAAAAPHPASKVATPHPASNVANTAAASAPAARSASVPGGTGRLPGVGHDATYRSAACPTPNIPGFPQADLGSNFKCGYLTVPENRYNPKGRKIRIAVAIANAATAHPQPDPILWLEGGPGGTGLAVAPSVLAKGINADRRVIFVDQRGTLHAQPLLSCPGYDRYLVRSFGLAPTGAAAGSQEVAAVRACSQHWTGQGYDLSAFNTSENAADLSDLRIALHVKAWNVYGVSYGTDLALQLLRDYPAGIRTEVLDSVVPPQVNVFNGFWPTAAQGYRAEFQACQAHPACHAAYPHLWRDLTVAVNRLTRTPLSVRVLNPATGRPVKVVFDGYQFANLLILLSLIPGSLVQEPALVHEMAAGDGAQAALALLRTPSPAGLTGYGLAFGVFCSEDAPFTTPAHAEAVARRALPGFPAKVLALEPQVARAFADCQAWHVTPANPAVRQPAHSNIPVLELNGTFDAITSHAWAQLVAKGLSHARILRFPGIGHGVVTWTQCGATVMVGFLNHPHGGYNTSCIAKLPT